ncbi:MAG: DUF3604 domain-containing protein [Pseudomonadota bacterium]
MKDSLTLPAVICLAILLTATLTGCGGNDDASEPTPTAAEPDYLAPELRNRVEQLKQAVSDTPTNLDNVAERAATLLEWGNAFSLKHGPIPVELTLITSVGQSSDDDANRSRDVYGLVDTQVHELALREEDPAAIGTLRAVPPGPFVAASHATFEQIYTVGNRGMKAGGGILVAMHALSNYPPMQTTDPAGANYVSITSSNAAASFTSDTHPVAGQHGGFRGVQPAHVYRLQGTDLSPGETITVTFGDTTGGGPGYLMQNFSNDRAAFPLYVDMDGSNRFLTLPIQAIQIVGDQVAGVHGFAPSVVAVGEPFTLSVRFEDEFDNLATPPYPPFEIRLNGEPFRNVSAPAGGISLIDGLALETPGVYRFTFHAGDIEGKANPVLVETAPAERIYWGDTHGHSGMAEGVGSAEGYMRFARDEARLDYVTHSEHDIWMDDAEWEALKQNVRDFHKPGEFIPFLGYEWSVSTTSGGHHNVLFRTPEGRDRVPAQYYPTLSRLYQGLREKHDTRDVVIIPHAHQTGEYRQSDPEMEHLIEIMSGHGTFEWFGRMYLNHGHQVGFIAASDDHLGHPGYSAPRGGAISQRGGLGALMAADKNRDSLFDAMRNLRAYATTGDRIILMADLNGTPIGGRAPFTENRRLSGRVIGTDVIDTITVIKNDRELWQKSFLPPIQQSSEVRLQLTFYSDSNPFHHRDNPRGWREWRGSLTVAGADLVDASATEIVNPDSQFFRREPGAPNRVSFATQTRGDAASINLTLTNVTLDTRIELDLEAANERGGAPQIFRRLGRTPAWQTSFALRDMKDNTLGKSKLYMAWTDTITLRRMPEQGETDVRFELTDSDNPRQGDYYFIRVKQVNDAYAWSSPIWVGGFPPR